MKNYQKKCDFRKAHDPLGKNGSRNNKNIFVIQKHDASRLHYDFRLQSGDVLISWAVPKGLSTTANEKRLAILVEPHALNYARFEGIIPKGEYGAGTVMVWDIGQYELSGNNRSMKEALKSGSLKFILKGKKLQGEYAMLRIRKVKGKEQWLIFKLDDKDANSRSNPVITEPDSVLTGRSLKEIENQDG